MKLVVEKFDSLNQYLDVIKSRKPNAVFENEKELASESEGFSFTHTNSYSEADELARVGYKEGLDKLKAANNKTRHLGSTVKALPSTGVVGFAPHVPNAITGVPNSMITTQRVEQRAKVISILYYMGGSCRIGTNSFIEAGKNVLNVIYSLELQGYRVALNVITSFCANKERAFSIVQIKNWRQPSNPLKISYPLIHPSFFRRHGIKWVETTPELSDRGFLGGYGYPLDVSEGSTTDDRRKWLKDNGILQDGWFYTERKEAEDLDADELIEAMGINAANKKADKPKRQKRAEYSPCEKYEPKRGMGLRFEEMDLGDPREYPEADGPEFSPEDLKLPPEELYRKLRRRKWY